MKRRKYTIRTIAPNGDECRFTLPESLAFAAARGIASETYHEVHLIGEYGTAEFDNVAGRGIVVWNEKSTTPGVITKFDERTTVCI